MKKLISFSLLIVLFVSCDYSESTSKYKSSIEKYPVLKQSLGKKILGENGCFFQLNQKSDSTVSVSWGNDTLSRTIGYNIAFQFGERIHFQWQNKFYAILQYGTGSGVWANLVLPLNKTDNPIEEYNILCFDTIANLIAVEQAGDTLFMIENLKTKAKDFVIEKQNPCKAALNNSCIDSISFSNRKLYLKWAIPNVFSDDRKIIERVYSFLQL